MQTVLEIGFKVEIVGLVDPKKHEGNSKRKDETIDKPVPKLPEEKIKPQDQNGYHKGWQDKNDLPGGET